MKINYADEITERLTMRDLMELYHETGRHNRTTCPFHNGKDNNFCYDGVVYHCWVCGAKGNVITFVKEFFGIDFLSTISKLNQDFRLGLPIGQKMTLRQQKELHDKVIERKKIKEQQRLKKEAYDKLHDELWSEWTRLDNNRRNYAPKDQKDFENLHPLYVEAVKKIDFQSFLIDYLL